MFFFFHQAILGFGQLLHELFNLKTLFLDKFTHFVLSFKLLFRLHLLFVEGHFQF